MSHTDLEASPTWAASSAACVGVDWGARRCGIHVLAADGRRLAGYDDHEGVLASRGRLAGALDDILRRWSIDERLPVLVSGLGGMEIGSQTVPTLETDVPLSSLSGHIVRLDDGRYAAPGYVQVLPHPDFMGGQAVYLAGLVAAGKRDGWVVLPGTQSRWVYLRRGRIAHWTTFVTGELFESQRHLGATEPLLEAQWTDDPEGFDRGLELAELGISISQGLFTLRASIRSGAVEPYMAASMLSGLLIGSEFHTMKPAAARGRVLQLIARLPQQDLYRRAAAAFGWEVEVLDAHALYGAGVRQLLVAAC